jgi:hypothetical protein
VRAARSLSMGENDRWVRTTGGRAPHNVIVMAGCPSDYCLWPASFVLISGLSYKTTFNSELWISSFPLYSI